MVEDALKSPTFLDLSAMIVRKDFMATFVKINIFVLKILVKMVQSVLILKTAVITGVNVFQFITEGRTVKQLSTILVRMMEFFQLVAQMIPTAVNVLEILKAKIAILAKETFQRKNAMFA